MSNRFLNATTPRRNRYLLMRHGHSQANAQGLIVSTPERGLAAFGLSPQGIAQLDALLADWRWPTPTRILHSDFLRTTETAARVATHFTLPLQSEPRLRERHFGDLEGQADDRYPRVWALDARSAEHVEHGVESVASVAERMQAVIETLEHSLDGETVLLVSHGDPLQILLTALEGRPLRRHRDREPLAPASLTVLP
ncbi:histidine phosphatase family protein [Halomonas sp. M5N1S17]|uniref:histidine phosphatase family protein n=1 Tax=Halomonas alkalisoli TaxID=2907158 RepID=UPI001F298062|nr:histidine phosphatase family protein [Halomonas alkalisoli]MCE9661830.1 histidine phosphatase family protein [Halomonas alkalisoli]